MKMQIISIEQLLSFFEENEQVYLYGAGKVCKALLVFLMKNDLYHKINTVYVTQKDQNKIFGINVEQFDDSRINEAFPILIATRFSLAGEIEGYIERKTSNIALLDDSLAIDLIGLEERKRVPDNTVLHTIQSNLLKFIEKPCMEYMIINILDHCNLRCKGCDHFACIAKPYWVSYESIYRDLERMSELLEKQYLVKLGVMGGEPLLHPDLLEILKAARKLFPATQIRLTTNGILLLQQNDEFWNVCRENKITIVITKYPLDLKYEEIKAKIKNENVLFHFFEGTGEGIVKKSFKRKINLEGGSNPVEMFANCDLANYGNFLMEGKLYGCPFSCQMNRIFNDIFAQEIPLTEKDFLDIYKVNGMDEVMKFASKARPICRFCSGVQDFCDWERSRGEISEWI